MTAAASWPRRLAMLLGVALAARAITLGSPIVHDDEDFYLAVAHAWAGGATPYVGVWDRKPIGLFILYLPAGLLPPWPSVWAYQLMALAAAVATAAMIARIADRAGWARGALPAGAAYLLWLDFADGQGGQSPVFYNALMAGAALLAMGVDGASVLSPSREHGFSVASAQRSLAAMLLVGLAAQIKYSVVFEGAWFGVWLLGSAWRRGRWRAALPLGAAMALAAALPTLAAAGAYAAIGDGQAWLYANVVSILQRGHDPPGEQLANMLTALAILGPALPFVLAGLRAPGADRRFVAGWAAAAAGGFAVFGAWFNHYTLPVLVPFAACAAGAFATSAGLRRWATALGLVAWVAGQGVLLSERHTRGTRAQFTAVVRAIGRGPGTLYVFSGSSLYYAFSGRAPLSRYLFPSHLQTRRENGAVGVSQAGETARILAQGPAVVVVQALDGDERADLHAAALVWLQRHRYRSSGPLPLGDKSIAVWRAPTS